MPQIIKFVIIIHNTIYVPFVRKIQVLATYTFSHIIQKLNRQNLKSEDMEFPTVQGKCMYMTLSQVTGNNSL